MAESIGFEMAGNPGWEGGRAVLMVGESGDGGAAVELVHARVVDRIGWDDLGRLGEQVRVDTLLVEAEGVSDDMLVRGLPQIGAFVRAGDIGVVVVLASDQIDVVAAELMGERTQLLCAPTLAERVAALAAAERANGSAWFEDGRRGSAESDRLRRLNEEVARIAETLAQLARTSGNGASRTVSDAGLNYAPPPRGEVAPVDPATVRKAIRARRLREAFFSGGLFEDPAWDMLLDLYAAGLEHNRVSVSSLCIAASVAPTTALRWIGKMVEVGLFERQPDALDRRRAFMVLSPRAQEAMLGYFTAAREQGLSTA